MSAATAGRPSVAPGTGRSRMRIWLRLVLAAVFGAVVVVAWAKLASAPPGTEEEFDLALDGLVFLSLFMGFPALLLAWSAARAARGTEIGRPVAVLAALFGVAGVGAVALLAGTISRPDTPANVGGFGRAGVISISYRGADYRDPNGSASPPRRTASWLVAHHEWPLKTVGQVPILAHAVPGGGQLPAATARFYRVPHPILAPAAGGQGGQAPKVLFVEDDTAYLEYRR